jgi:hypothetical protein
MLAAGCATLHSAAPTPATGSNAAEAKSVASDAGTDDGPGLFLTIEAGAKAPHAHAHRPAHLDSHAVLYAAITRAVRRVAEERGELAAFLDAQSHGEPVRLAGDDSEIECDARRCLVKVARKTLRGRAPDDLAVRLADALTPAASPADGPPPKRVTLGDGAPLKIVCVREAPQVECTFETMVAPPALSAASVDEVQRGKLADCALAPSVERDAQAARDQIRGGALLAAMTRSGHAVGYMLYAEEGRRVELLQLFLCGDLSHDTFQIEGKARQPGAWLPRPRRVGGRVSGALSLRADDATMIAQPTLIARTRDIAEVEVQFRLAGATADEDVFGADLFRLRLPARWLPREQRGIGGGGAAPMRP